MVGNEMISRMERGNKVSHVCQGNQFGFVPLLHHKTEHVSDQRVPRLGMAYQKHVRGAQVPQEGLFLLPTLGR